MPRTYEEVCTCIEGDDEDDPFIQWLYDFLAEMERYNEELYNTAHLEK